MRLTRISALAIATFWLTFAAAAPAFAVLEKNDLGCAGSAVITSADGSATSMDAADQKAVLPRSGDAAWTGNTAQLSKNHQGFVAIQVGPLSYEIGTWSSANDSNRKSTSGVHTYDVPDWIPPFLVKIVGEHVAAGDPAVGAPAGTCSGSITVSVGGDVFDSPVGIGAVAATSFIGLVFLSSGIARKL